MSEDKWTECGKGIGSDVFEKPFDSIKELRNQLAAKDLELAELKESQLKIPNIQILSDAIKRKNENIDSFQTIIDEKNRQLAEQDKKLSQSPYNELIQMRELQADSEREIEALKVSYRKASEERDYEHDAACLARTRLASAKEENEALRKEVENLKAEVANKGLRGLLSHTELVSAYEFDKQMEAARLADLEAAERRGWDAARQTIATTLKGQKLRKYPDFEDWKALEGKK